MEPVKRVAIIGHGLMGGSIRLALQQRAPALSITAIDRDDDLAAAARVELIILAAPVSQNIDILRRLPSVVVGEALVTDVGSTKATTVAAASGFPTRLRFIGGHPITGAATSGIDAARADLFEGRPWILTPGLKTLTEDLMRLRALIESLGATVHMMDALTHDRLLAYVSHLPQLAASALMHVVGQSVGEAGLGFAGAGLRDTTRLATSPGPMWRDIVSSNRQHVNAALDALIEALQALREREGAEAVPRVFEDAARWKQALTDLDKEKPK